MLEVLQHLFSYFHMHMIKTPHRPAHFYKKVDRDFFFNEATAFGLYLEQVFLEYG